MNEVYYHYKNTIKVCQSNTKRLGRKINIAGTTRLIIVIAIIMLIVTIGVTNLSISLIGVLVVLLAVLFVLHSKWCEKKEYSETLETICNNELQGLDYDFSAFDGAADKIDTSHSFTYDLDIFGDNSIFQSINRTVTGEGREILVNWFSSPLKNRQQIELRQIAIKELSKEVGLREHFLTIGKLYYKKQSNLSAISKTIMPFSRVWEFLIWVIPVVWVLLFIMYAINIVQIKLLFVTFILCAIIANMCIRQIRKIHQVVNRLNKTLRVFSELIKIIEESELTTESYTKIKERFSSSNITASKAIKDLSKRLDTLDQRENFFIAILNVFVLCDIRCVIGFIKWQQRHLNNLNDWFEALAEFDALCSLSTFAFYPALE